MAANAAAPMPRRQRAGARGRGRGCDGQVRADPRAQHSGRDGGGEAEQRGLGEQARRPRDRHPHVRPAPLGRPGRAVPMPTPDHSPNASGRRSAASAGPRPRPPAPPPRTAGGAAWSRPARGRPPAPARRAGRGRSATAPSAVPRPAQSADRDQAHARRQHDQHRLEHEAELGHAEVELAPGTWTGPGAGRRPATQRARASSTPPRGGVAPEARLARSPRPAAPRCPPASSTRRR